MWAMTSSIGFDSRVISGSRFHAVDCRVADGYLKAGWVYIDGHLSVTEVVRWDQFEAVIEIPPDIQRIENPTTFSYPDDTVDWRIINVPRLCDITA